MLFLVIYFQWAEREKELEDKLDKQTKLIFVLQQQNNTSCKQIEECTNEISELKENVLQFQYMNSVSNL